MKPELLDALAARRGIVCAIGAGGKKTTLYAIAAAHPGRVGITTTVFMAPFPRTLDARQLLIETGHPATSVGEVAARTRRVAWARPAEKKGRVGGIAPTEVAACHDAGDFDVTFVKADGARMRAIKAPNEDEPVLPAEATTVLVLVSARAFGQPLDERIAHRPERITEITGLGAGATITPAAVGHLLASPEGLLRNIPEGARVIPVINAVDDEETHQLAREAAHTALGESSRFSRVVLTSHRRRDPVVEVITRG